MSDLGHIPPDPPEKSARERVSALAARQSGVVARRQLALLDVGGSVVGDWTDAGYLHRRLPGVYAVGHTAPSVEADLTAALLYAGPGAMLSHATGAWWLGLVQRRPGAIQVSTPRRCRSQPGVEVRDRRGETRRWHRALPVAPVAHILVDYAATAETDHLQRALAQAEYRGWLDLDLLHSLLGHGRPGSAALRRALRDHEPRLALTESELERRMLALCKRFELPLPECNATIEGLRVDALWREQRVVVEVDGKDAHRTWRQIQHDRDRDLILRAAGYVVLRYGSRQLDRQPAAVAADIAAALHV
jgi:very-short-patch-repair endonuclease